MIYLCWGDILRRPKQGFVQAFMMSGKGLKKLNLMSFETHFHTKKFNLKYLYKTGLLRTCIQNH